MIDFTLDNSLVYPEKLFPLTLRVLMVILQFLLNSLLFACALPVCGFRCPLTETWTHSEVLFQVQSYSRHQQRNQRLQGELRKRCVITVFLNVQDLATDCHRCWEYSINVIQLLVTDYSFPLLIIV